MDSQVPEDSQELEALEGSQEEPEGSQEELEDSQEPVDSQAEPEASQVLEEPALSAVLEAGPTGPCPVPRLATSAHLLSTHLAVALVPQAPEDSPEALVDSQEAVLEDSQEQEELEDSPEAVLDLDQVLALALEDAVALLAPSLAQALRATV